MQLGISVLYFGHYFGKSTVYINMGQLGAYHVYINDTPKIRQVLQNILLQEVYRCIISVHVPSPRPFLFLISFASTRSIQLLYFPDDFCLEFSTKYAKYILP